MLDGNRTGMAPKTPPPPQFRVRLSEKRVAEEKTSLLRGGAKTRESRQSSARQAPRHSSEVSRPGAPVPTRGQEAAASSSIAPCPQAAQMRLQGEGHLLT